MFDTGEQKGVTSGGSMQEALEGSVFFFSFLLL